MARFKKGDRVRLIRHDERSIVYGIGETGTVDEDGSDCPWVLWDRSAVTGGRRWGCAEDNLELIKPKQPSGRIAKLEARVAELERAIAAKPEPQQEPEFLEGAHVYYELLKDPTGTSPFNSSTGNGIFVHRNYEAFMMPHGNNGDYVVIRFRKRKQ